MGLPLILRGSETRMTCPCSDAPTGNTILSFSFTSWVIRPEKESPLLVLLVESGVSSFILTGVPTGKVETLAARLVGASGFAGCFNSAGLLTGDLAGTVFAGCFGSVLDDCGIAGEGFACCANPEMPNNKTIKTRVPDFFMISPETSGMNCKTGKKQAQWRVFIW